VNAAADWVLGVDFGAVNTAAALRDPSGRVADLRLSSTGALTPSAAFYRNNQVLVGARAIEAGLADPAALEPYPKRRLATGNIRWNVALKGRMAYLPDLIAAVLSDVLERACEVTGDGIPDQLVLTYPDIHRTSFWESSRVRDGLQAASDLLVCQRRLLVPDSTAVAYFAQTELQLVAPAILLVNFGAAKCDAVVCTRQDDGTYAAVASRSVYGLGGFALESRVRGWVRRSLESSSPGLVAALDEQPAAGRLRLDVAVRDAIGTLSAATSADITIDINSHRTALRLTRDQFDVLTQAYVDEAVELTREMLGVADQLKTSSARNVIILTGSAAENPAIHTRIAELGFVADLGNPRTTIARSAAYYGAAARSPGGASASHSPVEGEPVARATAEKAATRVLLADITCNGRTCKKSLLPDSEHQVEVRLAVPGRGEEDRLSDEAAIPDGNRAVELVVDVSSDDGSVHGTASLALPMVDRTLASTVAVVKFVTGEDGATLRLNVTVLYEGRPVQAALLQAPVRAKPAWRDRIRLLPVPLSAAAEPRLGATKADTTLEYTGRALKRLGTADHIEIPLSAIEDITAAIERSALRVMRSDGAPRKLDDPGGVKLLIDLARQGSSLADKLADLRVTDPHTVALMVRYGSATLPIELAYDGVAPDESAQLCECVRDRKGHRAAGFPHASRQTVCPYAFWGMTRVIARTMMGQPVKQLPLRPRPAPLPLRPVLYGAADTADELSPPWALATRDLQDVLSYQAGLGQSARVSNWRAWRREVRRARPNLMVVLGHTEMRAGQVKLVIGRKSRLAQRSVSFRELGRSNVPAPLVLLMACTSDVTGDVFGALPGAVVDNGAAAVIATLTRLGGPQAAQTAAAVVSAMHSQRPSGLTLATALTEARQQLIAQGLLVGLLLVSHGEIDVQLAPT
jgi:hypothetical protein